MVRGCKSLITYFSLQKQKGKKKLGFSGVSISDRMESINIQKAAGSGDVFGFSPLCDWVKSV